MMRPKTIIGLLLVLLIAPAVAQYIPGVAQQSDGAATIQEQSLGDEKKPCQERGFEGECWTNDGKYIGDTWGFCCLIPNGECLPCPIWYVLACNEDYPEECPCKPREPDEPPDCECYFDQAGRASCQWGGSNTTVSESECRQQGCNWTNGTCICPMPGPVANPVAECEKDPSCDWVDGQCLCTMPDPGQAECESNPNCNWTDGQCLCTMPSPEEPMPGPVPNPVAECEANPGCHWSDGQCLCTGLMQ